MRTTLYLAACSLLLATAACNAPRAKKEAVIAAMAKDTAALLKRGEYLVSIMGCGDCHTPKKFGPQGPMPDMDRLLSGYDSAQPLGAYDTAMARGRQWVLFNNQNTAVAGPWGVSFAANLTPDPTGIGGWDLNNFRKALTQGKYKGIEGSRPLLPPMPWQNFAHLSNEDVEAIFSYLMSLKPVSNRVPEAQIAM